MANGAFAQVGQHTVAESGAARGQSTQAPLAPRGHMGGSADEGPSTSGPSSSRTKSSSTRKQSASGASVCRVRTTCSGSRSVRQSVGGPLGT